METGGEPEEFRVRALRPADFEAWSALGAQYFRETDPPGDVTGLEVAWQEILEAGSTVLGAVAESGTPPDDPAQPDRLLGLVLARAPGYAERWPVLSWLFVVPGWRGQGVGDALLYYARRWAALQGWTRLTTTVDERNYPARNLFDRCGQLLTQCSYGLDTRVS